MSESPGGQPRSAVLALHYQNDVLHADGRIRVGFATGDDARERVIAAAGALLAGARRAGLPIVHIRIAFRPDYADLVQNCPLFLTPRRPAPSRTAVGVRNSMTDSARISRAPTNTSFITCARAASSARRSNSSCRSSARGT